MKRLFLGLFLLFSFSYMSTDLFAAEQSKVAQLVEKCQNDTLDVMNMRGTNITSDVLNGLALSQAEWKDFFQMNFSEENFVEQRMNEVLNWFKTDGQGNAMALSLGVPPASLNSLSNLEEIQIHFSALEGSDKAINQIKYEILLDLGFAELKAEKVGNLKNHTNFKKKLEAMREASMKSIEKDGGYPRSETPRSPSSPAADLFTFNRAILENFLTKN